MQNRGLMTRFRCPKVAEAISEGHKTGKWGDVPYPSGIEAQNQELELVGADGCVRIHCSSTVDCIISRGASVLGLEEEATGRKQKREHLQEWPACVRVQKDQKLQYPLLLYHESSEDRQGECTVMPGAVDTRRALQIAATRHNIVQGLRNDLVSLIKSWHKRAPKDCRSALSTESGSTCSKSRVLRAFKPTSNVRIAVNRPSSLVE